MLTESKVKEIYCLTDIYYKIFEEEIKKFQILKVSSKENITISPQCLK